MITYTPDEFKKKYGSDIYNQLGGSETPVVKPNYLQRVGSDYSKAGSDIVSGIKSGADQIKKGNVFGGINAGLTTVGGVASAAFSPITEAPGIKQGLDAVGTGISKIPGFDTVASQLNDLATKHPIIAKDVKSIIDIATLGAGKAAEKPIAEGTKIALDTTKNAATGAIRSTEGLVKRVIPVLKPEPSAIEAVGKVVQGKTTDVNKAIQAFSSIDTKGIKTYGDLQNKFQSSIKTLAEKVDRELAKDTSVIPLENLTTKATTKSGQIVSTNYVDTALQNLDELYGKIGDDVAKANIQEVMNKAQTTGLTRLEVNDISRIYGQEFGQKAFSKLGEPLTSVNAQKYENVRTGLKSVAREGIGGKEAQAADKALSSIYNTQRLIEKNVEAVNKLKQRINERGLLEKVGHYVTKYADILTGGTLRGVIGGLLPRGAGYKVLNALDLEEQLAKNLKIITNAVNSGSDKDILEALKTLKINKK